jgi:hypothetical protein
VRPPLSRPALSRTLYSNENNFNVGAFNGTCDGKVNRTFLSVTPLPYQAIESLAR